MVEADGYVSMNHLPCRVLFVTNRARGGMSLHIRALNTAVETWAMNALRQLSAWTHTFIQLSTHESTCTSTRGAAGSLALLLLCLPLMLTPASPC